MRGLVCAAQAAYTGPAANSRMYYTKSSAQIGEVKHIAQRPYPMFVRAPAAPDFFPNDTKTSHGTVRLACRASELCYSGTV